MNTHDEQPKPADLNESKGRRRFVRAVGVAVPVALTVSARSTMAATCNVVSAHASINLTNSHNSTTDNTFGFGGPNLSMRQVLIQQVPTSTFASYIAAAYVNLGKEPAIGVCYTLQNLKDMWQYGPSGTFHPLASDTTVNWSQQQIIDYLIDTWTM